MEKEWKVSGLCSVKVDIKFGGVFFYYNISNSISKVFYGGVSIGLLGYTGSGFGKNAVGIYSLNAMNIMYQLKKLRYIYLKSKSMILQDYAGKHRIWHCIH